MKFALIIKEAGFAPEGFPNASEIPITLFDEKDRIIEDKSLHFFERLFAHCPGSSIKFYNFLNKLEDGNTVQSMAVKIDASSVCVFYKTPNARIFLRTHK